MTRSISLLGLSLLLTISTATRASGVAEIVNLGGPADPASPFVKEVDCTAHPPVTHQFRRDGIAFYTVPGRCRALLSDGGVTPITYHVDASWDPNKRVGIETGRIYDLGNVAPDRFQPGPPGTYTTFIVRMLCDADPWLNDARCGLEYASGVDELAKLIDRFSRGPFPLTKGAIPASKRSALLTEYKRATGQVVGPLSPYALKRAPGIFATQPKPPPPPPKPSAPYGAKYQPGTLQTLNRNQTRTLTVQVTNMGSLTWTPAFPNPFRLSYHWFRGTQEVIRDGLRTHLSGPVASNKSVTLNANLRAPSSPGTYILKWDMLQEGVTWFRNKGVATGNQTVVVK